MTEIKHRSIGRKRVNPKTRKQVLSCLMFVANRLVIQRAIVLPMQTDNCWIVIVISLFFSVRMTIVFVVVSTKLYPIPISKADKPEVTR